MGDGFLFFFGRFVFVSSLPRRSSIYFLPFYLTLSLMCQQSDDDRGCLAKGAEKSQEERKRDGNLLDLYGPTSCWLVSIKTGKTFSVFFGLCQFFDKNWKNFFQFFQFSLDSAIFFGKTGKTFFSFFSFLWTLSIFR